MPTLRYLPLESSSVGQPPVSSRHQQFKALSTHIYLALAITVVLTALRLIKTRLSKSQSALPLAASIDVKETKFSHHNLSTSSPTSCHSKRLSSLSSLWPWPSSEQGVGSDRVRGSHLQHSAWAATVPLPFSARTGKLSPFGQSLAMDGSDGDPRKDRSGSASRGVSTKVPGRAGSRRQQNPSPAGTNAAGQIVWGTEDSNSPHFSSWNPFEGHDSSGSDEKGKYPMSAQTSHFGSTAWGMDQQAGPSGATYGDELLGSASGPVQGRDFADVDFTTPRHFSRPPPPPPFAQPTFSDTMYRFEDRRPSYAVSIPPELDANFLHHPNPEYAGASTSSDVLSSSPQSTSPIPRRRSYTRSIPMGIPIPTSTSASFADSMTSTSTFSPSSYPPTSPLLPPPPPGHDAPPEYVFVGGPGGPGVLLEEREIDLHGEIVSVMDHTGHGWKRHTRVYGGGVCLACLAAEDQGGFYGDKVPLSDRR